MKLYDSLGAVLDRLHLAIEGAGANTGGALAAVLDLVRADTDDTGGDL